VRLFVEALLTRVAARRQASPQSRATGGQLDSHRRASPAVRSMNRTKSGTS